MLPCLCCGFAHLQISRKLFGCISCVSLRICNGSLQALLLSGFGCCFGRKWVRNVESTGGFRRAVCAESCSWSCVFARQQFLHQVQLCTNGISLEQNVSVPGGSRQVKSTNFLATRVLPVDAYNV